MYSIARMKLFVKANSEKKTPELTVIDCLKQVQSSLSDYRSPPDEIDVSLTEIIQPNDLGEKDPLMSKAIQQEFRYV